MLFPLPEPANLAAVFARELFVAVPEFLPRETARSWCDPAERLSRRQGIPIERGGADRLSYTVVTGDAIREQWPELYQVYESTEMRAWVQGVTGARSIFTSSHLASAININRLQTTDHLYRWHFDAAPYTLLLYLTDSTPADGGALEIAGLDGRVHAIVPRQGMAVLMDGSQRRHRVAPLARPALRLSIPMVYPATAAHQRPAGLDDYLYAPAPHGQAQRLN